MANIFDYAKDYQEIMQQIEEADGEITPEIDELLKINEDDVERKVKAYRAIMLLNESKQAVYKDEIDRLSQKKKSLDNINTRLKDFVKFAIHTWGTKDPKTDTEKLIYDDLTVYIRKTDVVDLSDEDQNTYEMLVKRYAIEGQDADVSDDYVRLSLGGLRYSDVIKIQKTIPGIVCDATLATKLNRVELLKIIKGLQKEQYPTDVPEKVNTKKSESVIFK